MIARIALAVALGACFVTSAAQAQQAGGQFPKRELGAVSAPLFTRALAQSEVELSAALVGLKQAEARYLSGESGGGFDFAAMLSMTTSALSAGQSLGNLRGGGVNQLMQMNQLNQLMQFQMLGSGGSLTSGVRLSNSICSTVQKYAERCRKGSDNLNTLGATTNQAADAFKSCLDIYDQVFAASCR